MKTVTLLIFLLAVLVGGSPSGQAAADKIDWHTYEAGMARSKFEKKKAYLYFHADWCGYCREMESKTFKDSTVIATLNRNFIPIRVDSDREKAAASLYRVRGLPFSLFLSEGGEKIGHVPGFIPPEQMLKVLGAVMAGSQAK